MGRLKDDFQPRYHPDRLGQPRNRKKPSKIFVSDMGDLFGDWVPTHWITSILEIADNCLQHIFQFLTKNPSRYQAFKFPKNCWLGTTIDYPDSAHERLFYLTSNSNPNIKFVSFEPLLGSVAHILDSEAFKRLDWIINGKMTGTCVNNVNFVDKVATFNDNAMEIIKRGRELKIPLFVKDNVGWEEAIQEFPLQNKN